MDDNKFFSNQSKWNSYIDMLYVTKRFDELIAHYHFSLLDIMFKKKKMFPVKLLWIIWVSKDLIKKLAYNGERNIDQTNL